MSSNLLIDFEQDLLTTLPSQGLTLDKHANFQEHVPVFVSRSEV